jgi:ppGpp synthetase/RelA/SpoT-type nucleotidyltranferase
MSIAERTERPVDYETFGTWYDRHRPNVLEPALVAASEALGDALADLLTDRDLARIRNSTGRVKSKRRTWRKINQARYASRIASVDDIPKVIDDLIGLRITCTNLRDIEMVQAALESFPLAPDGASLWLDPESERDYVATPKESGYRGWHVNLGLDVAGERMRCELQVRTLLQDSWGELTHEETYAKDGALPPLVEVLSKRMADLFATLDDIAEDLRTELDRLDEAAVAETAAELVATPPPEGLEAQASDAAALLLERWQAIDRPTDMGSLAWALQQEFGPEISDGWFGHGSFKRFLRFAVPDGEISTGDKPYLLPLGESSGAVAGRASRIPGPLQALRRIDRSFPLLGPEQWQGLYSHLASAWKELGYRNQSARALHELTRSARDRAEAAGGAIARRHFEHVARTLLSSEDASGTPLGATSIADTFVNLTLDRMEELRLLGDPADRATVRRWLQPS